MLKLIIKHKGKIIQEIPLQEDVEYVIGRGKDNNIVLPEQPGISRKHLRLSIGDDKQWVVKNLSQMRELNIEGEQTNEGAVSIGSSFQIQNFEFVMQKEKPVEVRPQQPEVKKQETHSKLIYKTESQLTKSPPLPEKEDNVKKEKEPSSDSSLPPAISSEDKTRIMDIQSNEQQLSAYLKISYDENTPRDIFKLEGKNEWTLGRDEEADIMVDSPNISREHFKIIQGEGQYYIKDLKSSNGTILNDKELNPAKKYVIQSGDIIYIMDIEIVFEVKNLSLEKELAGLVPPPPPALAPAQSNHGAAPSIYIPPPVPANLPGVIIESPEEESPSFFQKNKKRLIIYGSVCAVLAYFAFFKTEEKEPEENALPTAEKSNELTPQEMQVVKDTYQVAQQLYSQGKFEYCKSEIKKVHKYIDSYQDSKKLEIACEQAAENQRRQHDLEQKRQKAEKTEKFIQEITVKCREKFDTFKFKHDLIGCLNPAIELSPADSRIHSLTEKFDAIEMEKADRAERIAKRKKFINSIVSKYTYAKSLYTKGSTLKAIAAYQNFINISKHKELKEKHELAKRELAHIKKNFNDNNNRIHSECKGEFNANQFQKAYYTCKRASKQIPSPHNKPAINLMIKSKQKLEVAMKPIYEEASLNESVGNVSIAQEYWRKILDQDVKTGIYYKRAQEKLDKY